MAATFLISLVLFSSFGIATEPSAEDLLHRLESALRPTHMQIPFRETRRYQLRKTDMVFEGTMRLLENRGISIEYREPVHRIFILDSTGLRIRDPESGEETVAPDEASSIVSIFLDLLALNHERLQSRFAMKLKTESDDGWTLELTPETGELKRYFLAIDLIGSEDQLQSIFLLHGRSRWKRIEFLSAPEEWIPTPEDLQRFF